MSTAPKLETRLEKFYGVNYTTFEWCPFENSLTSLFALENSEQRGMSEQDDVASLNKRIDMLSVRVRRVKGRIRELEGELGTLAKKERSHTSIAHASKGQNVRRKAANMEFNCLASQEMIDYYADIFRRCNFDPPVRPVMKRFNRSRANRSNPKRRVSDLSLLPPIGRLKRNTRLPEPPNLSQKTLNHVNELLITWFGSDTAKGIVTEMKSMSESNAALVSHAELQNSDREEIATVRAKIMRELTEGRMGRLMFDQREILREYRLLLDKAIKDQRKERRVKMIMRKSIDRMGTFLGIETTRVNMQDALMAIRSKILENPEWIERAKVLRVAPKAKVSFSFVDSGSSMPQFDGDGQPRLSSMSTSNLPTGVPVLALSKISGAADFFPGTRSTRRVFSSTSDRADEKDVASQVDRDMEKIGRLLGNLYVERFAPELHVLDSDVRQELISADVPVVEISGETDGAVLDELFKGYIDRIEDLSLLMFTPAEIQLEDRTFLEFLGHRNAALEFLEGEFVVDTFLAHFAPVCEQYPSAAMWIASDLCDKLVAIDNKEVDLIFQALLPVLTRSIRQIITVTDLSKGKPLIALSACLSTFLTVGQGTYIPETIGSIMGQGYESLVTFFGKLESPIARRGFTSLLLLGRWMPHMFQSCLKLSNTSTSLLQKFMACTMQYPTCIRAACEFVGASLKFMVTESLAWHTAYLFHLFVRHTNRTLVRIDILLAIISVMTTIVSNRQAITVDQLIRFYFLRHLITQFQLEECVDAKPAAPQPPKQEMPTRVSYLDIPKLSVPLQIPSLNLENPKLQLHFQPQPQSNLRASVSITKQQYFKQRRKYPIYLAQDVHVAMVQLFFATVIDHSLHRLDVVFCDPFPQVNRKPNVLFTLMKHMEGSLNQGIIDDLSASFTPPPDCSDDSPRGGLPLASITPSDEALVDRRHLKLASNKSQIFRSTPNFIASTFNDEMDEGSSINLQASLKRQSGPTEEVCQFQDYERLLKLTVPAKFHPEDYSNGTHIASGAFGAVMAVTLDSKTYAVKILEKSRNEFDNPHLIDVFTEVSILEVCKGDRRVTQIHDYGCTLDSYYIVMEFYPHTLKSWRKSQKKPSIPVILRTYREFLHAATVLTDYQINHFDIKCDNVMLDVDGMPALADFGEAMSYKNERTCYTMLNRGTEWIKSPEMLSIALDSAVTNPKYDRRRKIGAGPASDVWSIGCLFYELVTGEYLFADSDWSRFFLRITDDKEPLITEQAAKRLPKDPRYQKFLRFVLQRNARSRPNLAQVIACFDEMFPDARSGPLPKVTMPVLSTNHESTPVEKGYDGVLKQTCSHEE